MDRTVPNSSPSLTGPPSAPPLGVTPAEVNQAIRALELRVGLPLFQRTTRRVGLTEAGSRLLARLKPAAIEIGESLEALGALREGRTSRRVDDRARPE